MFFEATLSSAAPDRQRIQRLCFATLISVGMTVTGLAGSWALGQLGIERVGGPRSTFELVEFSLLAPKPIDPPPPPPMIEPVVGGGGGEVGPQRETIEEHTISDAGIESMEPSKRIPDIGSSGGGRIPAGIGCPGGICGHSLIPSTTGKGCVGSHCGVAERPAPPPAEVSFSALHCLACSDPDRAELRRTISSTRKRNGSVALRFCVDVRGRVDASSIDVTESFGDAEVDRITRTAVSRWRFKPMQIAGAPRRACSETRFRITFD
jgi:TonB family protein